MKIAQKTLYAIRAMLHLTEAGHTGDRLAVADIAKVCEIPVPFLHLIFRTLKSEGLLHSQRGKGGGYTLARAADSISIAEILLAVEGEAGLSLIPDADPTSPDALACLCQEAESALHKVLVSCSLADLAERERTIRESMAVGFNI